jgi:AraC family transcriptional regulator
MTPRIIKLAEKRLIGLQMKMSLVENKTSFLWGQFAPRIKEILNRASEDKISMLVYPPEYFKSFHPDTVFEKWATVEVDDFKNIPDGMTSFILREGLYAVFEYKGSSSDRKVFEYIFSEWIPKSGYEIDNRPHFEVLGKKYRNDDKDSEEEIWIPIKEK